MKKIVLIIFCIVFLPLSVMASNALLSQIELSILGNEYSKENDIQRVERIEQYIYGQKKTGNINERIKTIQNDIGYSVQTVQKQKNNLPPVADEIRNNMNSQIGNQIPNIKEDSTVDYPIVDAMEQEVFKTTYKGENIYKRLDRLEEKLFNKKSQASLNDRVDKLAEAITPVKMARKDQQQSYSYDDPYADFFPDGGSISQVNDQSMVFHLAALEQELLKGNYTNDNVASRLSRLEQKLFNKTFPTDSDVNRMQRLLVAYNAKRSSYKYENNRKMQNMATASQIGGILLMILAILL